MTFETPFTAFAVPLNTTRKLSVKRQRIRYGATRNANQLYCAATQKVIFETHFQELNVRNVTGMHQQFAPCPQLTAEISENMYQCTFDYLQFKRA